MQDMLALRRQHKVKCHEDPILHQQTIMLAATRSDMLARVKAAINGTPRDESMFNFPRHHVNLKGQRPINGDLGPQVGRTPLNLAVSELRHVSHDTNGRGGWVWTT
ncbi:hypothetical protein GE21DRAFT_3641 [Neurospora crassa]|uniref:Uncharacterized protein n=1 Tax=Neurospora crassa (strain ATCC 24698 / 74-OR23-1A / CBS 708.71 / DSM 1257 / FGSC 987) TaxID=367110 RepID=V5IR76_NEUCR|nr:hypothetical protein NCU08415 [Neurospora crassa OR74A]ESA43711.1 hypothetical protein NCU08415 [Neurospora crassa OR74A]KHE82398.1 hypothetical protein GE21DRAFT_3641 [Neurospora crassa]|eukprot:XP_011393606.1 hypothetical protein NCU08415 [Neurospora crassa OR74A]